MLDSALFAGRYRILRTLGAGGMGVVYAVEDAQQGHRVMALKVMRAGSDAETQANYKSEFRNILGVNHPNIPQVFDFGSLPPPDNSPYFTTEFIDGRPLNQLAQSWTPEHIEQILVELCRALAFLHSRGLLHRDIKPENVLGSIGSDGEFLLLKLVDFGLAARNDHHRGETCGTLDYMAPEIIAGHPATVQSDLYALGILLYELATGQQPFVGEDRLALSRKRTTHEAPPPFHFRPSLPVGLSDTISSLIRIKPEERPASARHTIALLNERAGTDFPYETEQTRQAYIASGGMVAHSAARAALSHWKDLLQRGQAPVPTIIVGQRGLGRTRLFREFAAELALTDCACVTINRDSDWDSVQRETCRVVLLPNAPALTRLQLFEQLAQKNPAIWFVLGMEDLDQELRDALSSATVLTLHPLNFQETQTFVAATFTENSFEEDFAKRIYSYSLGFPAAIQQIMEGLLSTNLLQIGLCGWELSFGPWNEGVHPRVADYVNGVCQLLPPPSAHVLHLLACTATPLPSEVLESACSRKAVSYEEALAPLVNLHWCLHEENGWSLHFAVVRQWVSMQLDEGTRRQLHLDLMRAWSREPVSEHPLGGRERLFHDFESFSYETAPEEVARILKDVVDSGDGKWVHRFCEAVSTRLYPDRYRRSLLEIHAALEYIAGNLEQSAFLMQQFLEHGNIEVRDDTLGPLARYAAIEEMLGHTDHAKAILDRCRSAPPEGCFPQAGAVFGPLAWMAFKQGERDKARELAEEGLVRVQTSAMDADHAVLWNTVAMLRYYTGDYDSAALAWRRCLAIYEHLHDQQGIAKMFNNLGALAAQSGDRADARDLWKKSAKISHEIGDVRRLAGLYNNLGIDALEGGALREAEEYYVKALTIFRQLKNQREQVEVLSNLGELMFFRADYARAQAYLHEAVNLARSLGDEEGQIEPLIHLGKLLLGLEQLDAGGSLLQDAVELAQRTGTKKGEAQAYEGLALLWARQHKNEQAFEALAHALTLVSADVDPLAALHIQLTRCEVAGECNKMDTVNEALALARHMVDMKGGSYAEARLCLQGLRWAPESMDAKTRSRWLRLLSAYPEFLWRFHWAEARRLTQTGVFRQALEEYGRGVNVLKAISAHLTEQTKTSYFESPHVRRFKDEALLARKSLA